MLRLALVRLLLLLIHGIWPVFNLTEKAARGKFVRERGWAGLQIAGPSQRRIVAFLLSNSEPRGTQSIVGIWKPAGRRRDSYEGSERDTSVGLDPPLPGPELIDLSGIRLAFVRGQRLLCFPFFLFPFSFFFLLSGVSQHSESRVTAP